MSVLHCADDDLLMPVANKAIVAPVAAGRSARARSSWRPPRRTGSAGAGGAGRGRRLGARRRRSPRASPPARARRCCLGNFAQQHPQAAQLQRSRRSSPSLHGAQFGFLGEAANSVGGYLAGASAAAAALNAQAMLAQPRRAYLLLHAEPEFDCANPRAGARARSRAADLVVALRRSAASRRTTPTCCCRSRRSPRPPAPSSTAKDACRASTPS